MQRSAIREVLEDQAAQSSPVPGGGRVLEREALAPWRRFASAGVAKVTTGVRRSGKTVFTRQLLGDRRFASVDFDDERLAAAGREDLDVILGALHEIHGAFEYLFLDEVQNVPAWELFVNRLQRSGMKVFVSGSSAHMLSRELATHLTGRFIQIEVFPFSFREYAAWQGLEARPTTAGKAALRRALASYLAGGGFPEVVAEPAMGNIYLSSLYTSIITRDILARYRIRHAKTFREMAASIVSNLARPLTYNKLKNTFGLGSVHTARNYVDYLSEAYLVFVLDKYSPKPKEILNSPKKAYVIDTGLMNALSLSPAKDRGAQLENAVFLELLRRRALDRTTELFFWKDYQDREIDFVVRRGNTVTALVQVTHASGRDEVDNRERRSLLAGAESLRCKNLMIVTWDYEGDDKSGERRIVHIPAWKWLLMTPDGNPTGAAGREPVKPPAR